MKSAEDGRMYDAAHVLDGAMDRSVPSASSFDYLVGACEQRRRI
jgi:hypothetical protein